MNSYLLPEFLALYRALPEGVRQQARHAYSLFERAPHHPSLRFRQVLPVRPIFSARVGLHHRAVGVREGDDVSWFWIGTHPHAIICCASSEAPAASELSRVRRWSPNDANRRRGSGCRLR